MNTESLNSGKPVSRRKVFSLLFSNVSKIISLPKALFYHISKEERFIVKEVKESVSRVKNFGDQNGTK